MCTDLTLLQSVLPSLNSKDLLKTTHTTGQKRTFKFVVYIYIYIYIYMYRSQEQRKVLKVMGSLQRRSQNKLRS